MSKLNWNESQVREACETLRHIVKSDGRVTDGISELERLALQALTPATDARLREAFDAGRDFGLSVPPPYEDEGYAFEREEKKAWEKFLDASPQPSTPSADGEVEKAKAEVIEAALYWHTHWSQPVTDRLADACDELQAALARAREGR